MGFSPNSTSNNRQNTTRRVNPPHSTYFPPTTMNCVLFLALSAYLSWASLGRGRAMTCQLFCLSLAFLETYKAGVGTTHTTQTEQDSSGDYHSRCHASTPLRRARPHPLFFVEKTHKTVRMIMVERETTGACNTPDQKKRTAWLPAIFRRAEQGGHSFVTTDDDDDFDFLTNRIRAFISSGRV
ncbi:hypothetical protein F5144DRAFT_245119 [Chaetomium tenue]|uniref:Uncharacterized protein n=1 Tax=Chaetomium tenue TaxID=1854479 RepID=A0ACB7PDD9_9PEZI|nr:hypothetical protein F5144DRAFT_245119 [Chaetomium globosum]